MNLKQLAKHLQLSSTTVSRALNGYPEVSESTRKRVIAAAAEHQYQPCRHARQLATGCANTVAHVISRSQHSTLCPIFGDFIEGATDASSRLGYDTQLSIIDDKDEEAFYRQVAARKSVDGIVIHAPKVHDERVDLLNELGIPYVIHGRTNVDSAYTWLDVDNAQAIYRATRLLFDLGHERIALINGPEQLHFAKRRREGYLDAYAQQHLAVEPELMFQGPLTESHGFNSVETLLNSGTRITAIVVCGIVPAYGALRSVLTRGLVLGSDLSIVAFDDQLSHLANEGDFPLFTTVRSSIRKAGERVMELLEARIAQPDAPPVGERWEAELVIGRSTGRPTT